MLKIDDSCIKYDFIRSGGPGGQHVNKVASAVQLRFDIENCPSIDDRIRKRLNKIASNRISKNGELIIEVSENRSQYRNRELARQKLLDLIKEASHRPKRRIKTKPSKASKEQRIRNKKHRSEIKKNRSKIRAD